jgi:hypothetical protein
MKTELQKKFEEQTPTLKSDSGIEYLQTFITWLHFQVEKLTEPQVSEGEIWKANVYDKLMLVEIITIQNGEVFEVMSIPQRNQYFNKMGEIHQFDLLTKVESEGEFTGTFVGSCSTPIPGWEPQVSEADSQISRAIISNAKNHLKDKKRKGVYKADVAKLLHIIESHHPKPISEESCRCNFSKVSHDLYKDKGYVYCPYCAMRIKELGL